jgi:hypothetical protein
VLAWNPAGYQPFLELLLSCLIHQNDLRRDWPFPARNHRDEYIKATFKCCCKGAQQKWILVDMHVQPTWVNKLLLPPTIKNKWKEPPMTNCLAALVKHIAKLHQARLEACHCVKEFHLQRIRPIDRRKTLAFECPRIADPSHDPLECNIFVLSLHHY